MASPQLEEGHVRIANELLEALMLAGLTARHWAIVMAVARKCYGWSKKSDEIALEQFVALTGIKKNHVSVAIKELVYRRILTREPGKFANRIAINKHYKSWVTCPNSVQGPKSVQASPNSGQGDACGAGVSAEAEGSTYPESVHQESGAALSQIGTSPCPESGPLPCPDSVTTKDNYQKQLPKAKDNTPYPHAETETVVTEEVAAPQAASADDTIQPGLFAEDQDPGEQQTELKAKPQTEAEVIEGVFAYWQKTMGSPKSKLDDKRRKRIRDALKMGYSPRDLCRAIQGCSLTPHNQGKNDRGQPYLGIHVCLKDADQIDRFIANSVSPPVAQPKNRAQQQSDGLDAAAAEFAARMAAKYGTPEMVPGGYQVPNDGMTIDMNME